MRVEKINKAFAYRVPIGDFNYLQCTASYCNWQHANIYLQKTNEGLYLSNKSQMFNCYAVAKSWNV